eukprot:9056408-Alexandrium_andersonii.AAC.1
MPPARTGGACLGWSGGGSPPQRDRAGKCRTRRKLHGGVEIPSWRLPPVAARMFCGLSRDPGLKHFQF